MNTIFSPTISLSSQHQSIINDNDMTKSNQKDVILSPCFSLYHKTFHVLNSKQVEDN